VRRVIRDRGVEEVQKILRAAALTDAAVVQDDQVAPFADEVLEAGKRSPGRGVDAIPRTQGVEVRTHSEQVRMVAEHQQATAPGDEVQDGPAFLLVPDLGRIDENESLRAVEVGRRSLRTIRDPATTASTILVVRQLVRQDVWQAAVFGERNRPSWLMVAHQFASASEVTS